MTVFWMRAAVLVALMVVVSGCVTVSRTEGAENVGVLLRARAPLTAAWTDGLNQTVADDRVKELLAAPVTGHSAVQIALLRNPRIGAEYARLGIAQADVVAASRIENPVFSAADLRDGGARRLTLGLSQSLSDILLLSARKRLAQGEYERVQQEIGAAVLELSTDVESAWLNYVAAEQIAAMRSAVAGAADVSETMAQRFFDAGNVTELQLMLERSAASQARIAAARAKADAFRAKLELQALMGLTRTPDWTTSTQLPSPVTAEDSLDELLALARERRLDVEAARREVALFADALGIARHWRWLGKLGVGIERERETGGTTLTGPTLALALPIFSQGQAGIARVQGELEASRARLAALEIAVDNTVRLGSARITVARQVVDEYLQALIPQMETIVRRQQERQSYMLIGVFELLAVKQQEYDAYQGYLEAVRDYWITRTELARAIGGRLPSDAGIATAAIGVDAILNPPSDSGVESIDQGHDMSKMKDSQDAPESHKGHDMTGKKDGEDSSTGQEGHRTPDMKSLPESANDATPAVPKPQR